MFFVDYLLLDPLAIALAIILQCEISIGSFYFLFTVDRLVGDVLLATGFLSYCGPFNQVFRISLMDSWKAQLKARKIPFSADLNLTDMLVDAATVSCL